MKRLSLVLVLLVSTIFAYAALPDKKVEQLGLALITSEKVQKEIKLTTSQKNTITTEFKTYVAQAQNLLKDVKSSEDRNRKISQLRIIQEAVAKRVLGLLQPAQTLRFRQVVLQSNGIWSVLVPEITRTLGMKPAQLKKIETLEKNLQKSLKDLETMRQKQIAQIPQPKDPKNKAEVDAYRKTVMAQVNTFRAGDKKTLVGLDKKAQAQALNVLTPAQRTSWKAMLGSKAKFIESN